MKTAWDARAKYDPGVPQAARSALDSARRSPASRFAPEALAQAEASYREGMAQLRRQELRFFLLRDFRPAIAALSESGIRSRAAGAAGREKGARIRRDVSEILTEVGKVMDFLDDLETRSTLPQNARAGLAGARMSFVEASSLLESGAFPEAESAGKDALVRAEAVAQQVGEAVLRFADEERVKTWKRWIEETASWSRENRGVALVVVKERNLLQVYRDGQMVRSYRADLGMNNLAQKYRRGDQATPEGRYRVQEIKDRGATNYYRALLLDYPTAEDLRRIESAKKLGIIPANAGPGALIEVHGEGGRGVDWTNGCVALTNAHMDELFGMVRVGTPVTIVGGDGSRGPFSSLAERLHREGEGRNR